jgi:antitoxin (DNA-binding transcriptional repressor) of toxin-antitoxin stability system
MGPTRRVDVSDLPDEVVRLLDALAPGTELVVTRDGEPVATIRGAGGAPAEAGGAVVPPAPDRDGVADGVTVVATAMRLSAAARAALSARLGEGYIVLDLRAAPPTTDVLLVPPASPQLVGGLRAQFPQARLVVAEIEDDELGVSHPGPVRRMLDAGAEAYLTPTTIARLAPQLDRALTRGRAITGGAGERPEIAATTVEPG